MRFKLHELPAHLQAQVLAQTGDMAAGVCNSIPEYHAGEEQVVAETDEGGGSGRIVVRIIRHGAKLLDADNLCGGVKWTLDSLRYAKVIPEDNPKAIKLIVGQVVVPKAQRGTLIEIYTE